MKQQTKKYLATLTGIVFASAMAVWACGDSDKNTDPHTGANGCIAEACYDVYAPGSSGGPGDSGPVTDAGPLDGTSKTATLVVGGLGNTMAPVWIGGSLLFSDTNSDKILQLAGTSTTDFRTSAGNATGNAVDSQGRLVTCEANNNRVVRSAASAGSGTTAIAAFYKDAAIAAPYDVVGRSDGNLWFTDPPNVFRLSSTLGLNQLTSTGIGKPAGVAVSADNNTLYVVDNTGGAVFSVPLQASGSTNGAPFTKLIADAPGGDGIAIDDQGNLYVACNDGVRVFTKAGASIGTVTVPEQPSGCTFGGTDRRTLYITARTGLYSIVLNVPGLP